MQIGQRWGLHWAGAIVLSLLLSACASGPGPRVDKELQATGSGRFTLSGGSLAQPIQGRYEWGRSSLSEWVVFSDPWGNALGTIERPWAEHDRPWEIRDESGLVVSNAEAGARLSERLGLSALELDEQVAQLARGLLLQSPGVRTLELSGRQGGARLRVVPDTQPTPPQ